MNHQIILMDADEKELLRMFTLSRNVIFSMIATFLLLVLAACGSDTTPQQTTTAAGGSTTSTTPGSSTSITDIHHASGASRSFQTLNDNQDVTFNQLLGINDHGVIAGYFGSGASGHPNKGYTLRAPYGQGNYTDENFPGSVQTQITAINNQGDTAGFWVDGQGNNFGFIAWHGVFKSYKNPNTGAGTVNQLLGLNDNGIAVGFYTDAAGVNHAYELN